jgi:myo-inositol-hexaphosphate 3-phosphohydrolase
MYWGGRGITWVDNNLVALYRHKDDSTLYKWRYLAVDNDFSTVKDTVVVWEHLNNSGVFALDYDPNKMEFLLLGTDSTNNYILFTVSSKLEYDNSYYEIPGSALGITVDDNSKIYLSLPDRKIEEFTRPEG